MSICKVCKEKDEEIKLLKDRVRDILKGYQKDKKLYMKVIFIESLIIIASGILLSFGIEGLERIANIIKQFLPGS